MRRYLLVDAELDEVAGDTARFFAAHLRSVAFALSAVPDFGELEGLTPERASAVLDMTLGDDIGFSYECCQSLAPGEIGYEVYEPPAGWASVAPTSDRSVMERLRTALPLLCCVRKVHAKHAEPPPGCVIIPLHGAMRAA